MEAATLQSKKVVNKGKLKKTIKNVLCRPDPVFWPLVSHEEKQSIVGALSAHKVDIPKFEKPHWKMVKQIPKEERPKPPKRTKVDGLLFGITECREAIRRNQCSVIIIEAAVNPKIIVQPLIEACVNAEIPVLCVNNFKIATLNNFGIPTSCFGIKRDYLLDLQTLVLDIAQNYKLPQNNNLTSTVPVEPMDVSVTEIVPDNNKSCTTKCPYLYRTSRKQRVFIPSEGITIIDDYKQNLNGQNFISLPENISPSSKSYMKMIVKRISNNSNRVKVK